MLTCICELALISGRLPVIIGAAPYPKSGWGRGRRLFANGTSDRKGPPRLQPSIASTSIKRKRVKKSKPTAPSQSPSPVLPPPGRTSQQSGKTGISHLDDNTDNDTSSLSDPDEYQFIEDADDTDQPVAPHPTKPIPAPAKTTAVNTGSKQNERTQLVAVNPATKQPTVLPSNKPAPPSVKKASKEDIQQHMQHMEAVASTMFTTPLGAPPTKKLRMNTTSITGVIPPSRPPSAPAPLSLAPAVAVAIPFRSPSVPTTSQSAASVPLQAHSAVMEVPKAWVAPVHVPPTAESAPSHEPPMAEAVPAIDPALMTASVDIPQQPPSSTFLPVTTLPPRPRSALAPPTSLPAPPTTRQPLAPLAPIPEAANIFPAPPYYGRGPRRPYVARGQSQESRSDVEMLDEGAHPEPLVGPGMAGRRFNGYDPRFGGYSDFGYNEHGYADSMFPREPYALPYYGPYGSEGWHGQAVYPWGNDVEVPEARGNTFHPRYPPPHFPSRPPPHSYSQPYGGPHAGLSRLPPGPPPILNDQNHALKGHPDQECDEDGL